MPVSAPALLDRFVPFPDARGRHQITIHAPAPLVMEVAQNFDIESLWIVRTLIKVRALLLRAPAPPERTGTGLIEYMTSLGWQRLAEDSSHYFIAGAACQPWQGNPGFSPVAPETFAAFAEPDRVKIAWTIETADLAPALTRFATETRAVATDEAARVKFRRYWRKFGMGIVLIRLILLPAVRRRAQQLWREQSKAES